MNPAVCTDVGYHLFRQIAGRAGTVMQEIPVNGMIPSASQLHIPEVFMKTTRQIPRGDAWTQIAMLDTGKIVTEGIAEFAGKIRPDIASGRIRRVKSRWRFVRSKRVW